jgi:ubiquinone biosynthesis protein
VSVVLQVIVAVPLFILFAWFARRLLGVRRLSVARTVIAALVGFVVAEIVARVLIRQDFSTDLSVVAGGVLGLLATMLTIVGFEALANPAKSRARKRSFPDPVGVARRTYAQGRRSIEIAQIASRHGLGKGFGLVFGSTMTDDEAATYGADLRAALEEAGGVFVKFGQLLSARVDIVPVGTANELALLQQDVQPAPRDVVEPALERSLGRRVDEVFSTFDWDPIGAASIGQVYRAELVSGERVVVKVRRPDVEETVAGDLQIALDLAALAEDRSPKAARLGIAGVADQFAAQLRDELDYRVEARNTAEVAASVAADDHITVPTVHRDLSSESVLVLDFVDGEPLGRHGPVGGETGRALADALFRMELEAMLTGDRFHADPHPGNVMIRPDGTLGLIDFGSAGRLDAFERAAIADILMAISSNDPALLRSAAIQVGMGDADVDPGKLDRAFARLMADHLGSGAEITVSLLQDFLAIANDFQLRMPPSVTEMFRALITLQGSLELLSPNYPLIDAAQAMAEDQFYAALTVENLADEAKQELVRLAPVLRRAPHHLDRIADQVEQGKFTVRVSMFSDPDDVRILTYLANRFILAFVGATLGVVSAMLFQLDGGPSLTDNISIYHILGWIGMFTGATLIMRVVLDILGDR